MKRVLITGANSYIGDSFRSYLIQYPDEYSVDILDTLGFEPTSDAFRGYDVVFNVAGIAHIKETKENRGLYYKVNRDLVINIARLAKEAGVKQFILLSTMSVYGKTVGHIKKKTRPHPINAYGKSKLQADIAIKKLADKNFKFACLRPPMVYGKDCKGNYQVLKKFALKTPVFPDYSNQRSMIYVDNLCEFVKNVIDNERSGLFFPQNKEYVSTSDLVKNICGAHGKRMCFTKAFNFFIRLLRFDVIKKVFGTLIYERVDLVDKYSFEQSIFFTENVKPKKVALLSNEHSWTYNLRKEIIEELLRKGYEVTLILPYGEKVDLLTDMGCKFIDVPMFERRGKNPIHELKLIVEYFRLLHILNPDVVLTYTIKPNLYGGIVCGLLHIPYIVNITGLGTGVDDNIFIQKLIKALYKIGLKHATCVFAQNKGNKEYLVSNNIVDTNKIQLLPGSGVNLSRFEVSTYPEDSICRFVFISRLLKEKGIEDYIKAAKIVKKKYPLTEFHVCGFCEEDYKKQLTTLNMDEYVIYHGMIDDVPEFIKNMHCLVHPSYYLEGISNVCLEASASGRPVITTDHEGCRDTVDDGVTGYVVPIKDYSFLAKTMIKFIELPLETKIKMGREARRKVEKEFDRKIVVEAYLNEINGEI